MNIFQFILKHPLAVITVFCLITLLGFLMALTLPLNLYPDFNPPILTVVTIYPQATPEEIEEQVTKKLEEKLGSISGLDKMSSYSGNSVSRIVLEFAYGLSMISIENDIRSRLGQLAAELPREAEVPVLYKFNINDEPIVELAIKAGGDQDLKEIFRLTEKDIKSSFEQLEGVAAAELKGIRDEVVEVSVIRNRLEAFSLNLTTLAGMLRRQNRKLGSGTLDEGGIEYSIQADGGFSSLEDIRKTVLTSSPGGAPVRVGSLAEVFTTLEDPDDLVTLDGSPAIGISIMKQSDANVVETTDQVLSHVQRVNGILPEGYELVVISESTDLIRLVISTIMSSGLLGGLLAMSVILFFLHRLRPTLIIFISIPVSLLAAVGGLGLLGKSLNILTMGGLVLGLGMIVDGSIVVLENIMVYYEKGVPLKSAAMQGAREMAAPITGSTLTSICVFLPLLFLADSLDLLGVLFKDMSLSVILALSASLGFSLFLVPVLSVLLLPGVKIGKQKGGGPAKIIERGLQALERQYLGILKKVLRNRGAVLLTALTLLVSSVLVFPRLDWQFLPRTGEKSFVVDVDFPRGTSLDMSEKNLMEISDFMKREMPWLKGVLITAKRGKGRILGILPPLNMRPLSHEEMKDLIRKELRKREGTDYEFVSTDDTTKVGNTGKLVVYIRGTSREPMLLAEQQILTVLASRKEVLDFSIDREKERPELSVSFFRDRAFQMGVSMEQGAAELRAALTGIKAGEFRGQEDPLDIVIRLRPEDRSGRSDLNRIFLVNPAGVRIPLSNIAEQKESLIPGGLERENQVRTIKITAQTAPGYSTGDLQRRIQNYIDTRMTHSEDLHIDFGGETEDALTYGRSMVFIFALAVLLVFAVMVCQFESLKSPFIIMLVLPFMFVGIVLGFMLMSLPVSMITIIGSVMLAGIVVNNGIVMVDYTNLLRERGMSVSKACREAGRSRLRPVLMTTMTTVLAMVPLGFFPGEGAALLQPFGITIVGGLLVSTVATLLLIPVLYSLFHKGEDSRPGRSK
ncbi:MAG: efflux RND transporter permease subunit [Spirochaetales bacterium]|nr:efflux RND transporter permease subunit [Spirochaetales bacterium]